MAGSSKLVAPFALIIVVVTAAPAMAAWSSPRNLSAAGQPVLDARVAIDADGDSIFTWSGFDGDDVRIQGRARSAAGALSAVQNLSPAGQSAGFSEVATDPDGNAIFTWTRFDGANERAQARARSSTGVLSPVQTLSPAGLVAADPAVAVDRDGDAVFTWDRLDGEVARVQARARSAAGVLSPVQTLAPAGAVDPQVAVDRDGDAVFTWRESDGENDRIRARARSAAGVLSAVQTLSRAGEDAGAPQVAVDRDGDAVFTWERSPGANSRVQARARSAAGDLSPVETLSAAGGTAGSSQVAVDADGDAVFTWVRHDGEDFRVQARTRSATGALSAVETLSAVGQAASFPDLAVDPSGDAAVSWQRSAPSFRIQAAFGP